MEIQIFKKKLKEIFENQDLDDVNCHHETDHKFQAEWHFLSTSDGKHKLATSLKLVIARAGLLSHKHKK